VTISCALYDQYELTRHLHNLEFWWIMNGFTMSTVCQVKASFCCIIGLDVNREIEPVLVYLRWTLVLWMCRTKQRCNLQNWTCGIRSFSWLHLWFWLFINLGAHGPRIMIYWNISLWCSSLLTRWQVLSPAVSVEEEICTAANPGASTEELKPQLSNNGCSGEDHLLLCLFGI